MGIRIEAAKPCPFCGYKGAEMVVEGMDYVMQCQGCGATAQKAKTRPGALAAWNRRKK